MLTALAAVIGGLLILAVGGEILLRGAVGLATILRLTPAVIGLTVVAAGTSVPELAVSAVAAWKQKADITVGNVVGSNICNIALTLGVVALYRRIIITGNTIKLEYPVMLLITLVYLAFARDGIIDRLEAVCFVSAYVCFTAYLIRVVGRELNERESSALAGEVDELSPAPAAESPGVSLSLFLAAVGVALLAFGADVAVQGASELGVLAGLSERVIGLTIVAVGTSLPELITSLVSSYRGRDDIAVANIIGSNIFNICGILGLTALASPLPVSNAILRSDNLWMFGTALFLFPIMRIGFDITRREGAALLAVYLVYLVQLVLRA